MLECRATSVLKFQSLKGKVGLRTSSNNNIRIWLLQVWAKGYKQLELKTYS